MPAPCLAELLESVELETVRVPNPTLKMPPPLFAELLDRVEFVTVAVPEFQIPPPSFIEVLLSRVELVRVRVPALINAPPRLVVFAPETVTPEMLRFPSVAIWKIRKLIPPALRVRVEGPGPVRVRVPRAPPEINWVALRI